MKLIFSLFLFGIFSISYAQVSEIGIVDFYKWTSNNDYEVIFVTDDFYDSTASGVARVRYQVNGVYKVVEYNIYLESSVDEDGYVEIDVFALDDNYKLIQGDGTYSPDNFILYFDTNGYFLMGSQADNNQLYKEDEDDIVLADVEIIEYATKEETRTLIKKFYSSSDPLYDQLMMYVGSLDKD
jgi:hypothetical protein